MPTDDRAPTYSDYLARNVRASGRVAANVQVPPLSDDILSPLVIFHYEHYTMVVNALGLPGHLCLDVQSFVHEKPGFTGVFGMTGGNSADYDRVFIGRTQFPASQRALRLPTSHGLPATAMVALIAGIQKPARASPAESGPLPDRQDADPGAPGRPAPVAGSLAERVRTVIACADAAQADVDAGVLLSLVQPLIDAVRQLNHSDLAAVDRGEQLAAEFPTRDGTLDELVHDHASRAGTDVNNGGTRAQITYLLRCGESVQGIRDLLTG